MAGEQKVPMDDKVRGRNVLEEERQASALETFLRS